MQDLRAVNEIIIPIHPLVPDPVPSSPECRGTPNISLFWTSEMHFSVFPYTQALNSFWPLSGETLTAWRLPNIYQDSAFTGFSG